jgi:Flp pilus assembly protein TadG
MRNSRLRRSTTRQGIYSARSRTFIKKDFRGAALVEAAIVFIPLSVIVFGIIEYGFIFKNSLTLSSATRAGARTASAMPKTPSATFFPAVMEATKRAATAANFQEGDTMWIYEADADGNPKTACGTTGSDLCVVYTYRSGNWNGPSGGWNSQDEVSACLGGTTPGAGIDSVGIRLELSHKALTGFFTDMDLREKTVMKFEPTQSSCA